MGERTDGLDPATGSTWTPAPGLPDPGVPVYRAGDVERTDTDDDSPDDPEIIQARAEIEETRAEMSDTIDALKERLSPQRLAEEAKESVREATIGRAETAVHNAAESAKDMVSEAGMTAKGAGNRMLETLRENPVPAALIGIGAGWLMVSARQHDAGPARYEGTVGAYPRANDYYTASGAYTGTPGYEASRGSSGGRDMGEQAREGMDAMKDRAQQMAGDMQDKAQNVAGRVQDTAEHLSEQARMKAMSARYGLQEQVHSNPLGVGLAAMALGVAVGLALPETRQENRLMGEARENVMERVGQTASEMAQKVQSVAQEAVSTATETAQQAAKDQGLTAQ